MDIQRGPLVSLAYFCQGKSMEELKLSLLYTTLELQQTRIAVEEELRKRDPRLIQLKTLLSKAMRERDEAQEKCQALLVDKLMLHQQQQVLGAPLSGASSVEDEQESIVSSPVIELPQQQQQQQQHAAVLELVPDKPLPEKGKLLQAVMKAGPLLETLILAGQLPQWRHPPPPLDSFEIPPVTIPSAAPPQLNNNTALDNCGKVNGKRGLYEYDGSDSPTETKYQRLILP